MQRGPSPPLGAGGVPSPTPRVVSVRAVRLRGGLRVAMRRITMCARFKGAVIHGVPVTIRREAPERVPREAVARFWCPWCAPALGAL